MSFLSICIPSYNRPKELYRLLLSLSGQKGDFDIIIAEDCSPKRKEIKIEVEKFISNFPDISVKLHLNEQNLGYDGNLRNLFGLSDSAYCMIVGDDDIIHNNCIEEICEILQKNADIGMMLRAWQEVDLEGNIVEFSNYYPTDVLFEKGRKTIIEFFRKSIFISGLTFNRKIALEKATDKYDGLLLYQIYLLSEILLEHKGYYYSKITADRIKGAEHYFGSSEKEKNLFAPKTLEASHSINFMNGFLQIMDGFEQKHGIEIKKQIQKDFSKKSFGYLSIQRNNGFFSFIKYAKKLIKMGFARGINFYIFFIILLLMGQTSSEKFILKLKTIIKK